MRYLTDDEKTNKLNIQLDIDYLNVLRWSPEEVEGYCIKKLKDNPTKEAIEAVLELSERFGLIYIKAQASKCIGDIYYDSNKYNDAFFNYMEAIDLYNKILDINNHGYLYNRLGICKSRNAEYLEALIYYNKAYIYSKDAEDETTLKKALYNLGRCYDSLEQYDAAIQYLDEFVNLIDRHGEFKCYVYAKILIASCYKSKNQVQRTINIYNSLIAMCKEDDYELLGYIYNNLGIIYADLESFEESIQYFNLSLKKKEGWNMAGIAFTYVSMAEVFIKKRDYDTALDLIYKSLSLSKERLDEELQLKTYYTLSDIYLLTGDMENLKKTYSYLTNILKDNKKIDLIKIYAKLADIALQEQDNEVCKGYLNKIQNIQK